ncbi:MAG TPA: hypothetical protein VMM13_01685 [Euzebya sp.]|nr:hypothetical protein [Euzebya sp.]
MSAEVAAAGYDVLDAVRARLDGLDQRPIAEHVQVLGASLDVIVGELDELARSIPPAR